MNVVFNWKGQAPAMLVVLATILTPDAASAEIVTLHEVEELALQNQERWESVEATTAHANAELEVARAAKRPTFGMNLLTVAAPGSFIEQVQTVDGREVNVQASPTVRQPGAFRPNARYEAIIDMRAPLYDGRAKASIKAAEAYRAAAEAGSGASRESVLAVVRASYLDWMAHELMYRFAVSAAEEAKAQRARIEERVAQGDLPGTELDAARYEELQVELAASEALTRAIGAKSLLESTVGAELSPEAEPDVELLEITAAESKAPAHSEVDVLERQGEAARREAQMHRGSRVPALAIIGQTGVAGINERVFPMYRLGVSLAVPFWDGGRAVAMAHAAEAEAIELEARARDAQLKVDEDRQRALLDRKQAEEQLVLATNLVSISEKRVEQAQARYDLGAVELESVADARAALRDARSRLVQIQVARSDAILRIGEGSAAPGMRYP
ncbi:MAG: TolC family protein [Polyangiales bacterium]